ncbi:MAG: NADAR family protein [Desulfobacteraceae bacterium]|nr:NADAR family protein [Desulfobacteraceae bacterium]
MEKILFYLRKEAYGWLSNFERATQRIDRVNYPTNEHYYQAQKVADPRIRAWILMAPNPHCAMIAGRGLREQEIVKDWDLKRVTVMYNGLKAKFSQNPELRAKLIQTGEATLHEDSPTDMFWGIKGDDRLGKLLGVVREKMKTYEKCPKCGIPTLDPVDDEPMCDLCGWAE